MPDSNVSGLLASLRELASRCSAPRLLYLSEDDNAMLVEAADALDKALNDWAIALAQRNNAREELDHLRALLRIHPHD